MSSLEHQPSGPRSGRCSGLCQGSGLVLSSLDPASVGGLCFIDDCQPRFSVLRQPGQIRAFFLYRWGLSRLLAYLRWRAVKTRSWRPSHQRFRLPDSQSRAGVRRPVRPRSQYRHLLRSIDVAFDFSVSLDYSVTSQSARSLQVPPSNLQIIVQPNPHRARAGRDGAVRSMRRGHRPHQGRGQRNHRDQAARLIRLDSSRNDVAWIAGRFTSRGGRHAPRTRSIQYAAAFRLHH